MSERSKSRREIGGIITALITPFTSSEEVDERALRKLVQFQLRKKVHGFFVCGTTGLGPLLTIDERKKVATTVTEETGDGAAVVIQVGMPDTKGTVELAKHAEEAGAGAVACITPYYYKVDEAALIEHYEAVSKAVSLPVFVYNIPSHTGVNLKTDTLMKLVEKHLVVGMKDSSRDFLQLVEVIERLPADFLTVNGTESYVLPAFLVGARGAVSAISNAIPEIFLGIYDSFRRGDFREGLELQRKLNRIRRITDRAPLSSVYEVLRERGIECGNPRRPFRPMGRVERTRMLADLKRLRAF
ncbi:MAG: dihydrodipicolinate synthase family protein [Thaumarchaeota archaeon]|nr:MAG: dihydrodipicolinate synthase family protein [Nitrososphaerota archaeon]